ncbi:MAG: CPBP family intramembrane glutamic endopeptidase [Promethearchaeati archaeon]
MGLKWYLAAFLIMLAPLLFALIYILIGGESPGIDPSLTLPLLVFNLFYTLFSGPLSEELGWRGFALPRLQSRFTALLSSIILGFIWASWHLPLYFIPPQRIAIYIFIPLVLVISILMTWVYNNTGGSVLLTIIMHFSFNFDMAFIVGYLGLMPTMIFYISASIAIGIYLIAVIGYAGPKKLSRKRDSEIPKIN